MLLAISRSNRCTFCVAVHRAMADGAKVPTEVTDAIRDRETLPDAPLAALARFTMTMVETRELPSRAEVEAFLAAGFEERDILQILLAIAVKTISNYTNHLFHTPLEPSLSHRAWED